MSIHVLDGTDVPNPEDRAMLQALYSRSPKSVVEHLEKVRKVGSGKFMSQFYTGYGHKSIGDCAEVTIFVEDCSILAAKAIQDHALYRGQEASTRYLDMAARPLVSPTPAVRERQERWMGLYRRATDELPALIRAENPRQDGEDEKTYEKAVKARVFDIARSLLPAGVTTFVSWTTDLRQAADHLKFLVHHPLQEVRDVATGIWCALSDRYPSSFKDTSGSDEEMDYLERSAASCAYGSLMGNIGDCLPFVDPADYFDAEVSLDADYLSGVHGLLRDRPKCELHPRLRLAGHVDVYSALDYGSWRDLQRHRSMVAEVPLLTAAHGFHPWYLRRLPVPIAAEAAGLAKLAFIEAPVVEQYALPLGMVVPVTARFPLPAAVYVAEIRSGQTVHPTLRVLAQKLATTLKGAIPHMALYADMTEDAWSLRRGKQDIVEVKS